MKKRIGFLFAMLAMLALLAMALGSGVALADDTVVPIPGIEVAAVGESGGELLPIGNQTYPPGPFGSEWVLAPTIATMDTATASTVPRVAMMTLVATIGLGVLTLTIAGTTNTAFLIRCLGSRIRTFTEPFGVAFGLKRLARGHPQCSG